jgi:hypothetical protein
MPGSATIPGHWFGPLNIADLDPPRSKLAPNTLQLQLFDTFSNHLVFEIDRINGATVPVSTPTHPGSEGPIGRVVTANLAGEDYAPCIFIDNAHRCLTEEVVVMAKNAQ